MEQLEREDSRSFLSALWLCVICEMCDYTCMNMCVYTCMYHTRHWHWLLLHEHAAGAGLKHEGGRSVDDATTEHHVRACVVTGEPTRHMMMRHGVTSYPFNPSPQRLIVRGSRLPTERTLRLVALPTGSEARQRGPHGDVLWDGAAVALDQ